MFGLGRSHSRRWKPRAFIALHVYISIEVPYNRLILGEATTIIEAFYSLACIHHSGLFVSIRHHCIALRATRPKKASVTGLGYISGTLDLMLPLSQAPESSSVAKVTTYIMVSTSVIGSLRIHGLAEYWTPYKIGRAHV